MQPATIEGTAWNYVVVPPRSRRNRHSSRSPGMFSNQFFAQDAEKITSFPSKPPTSSLANNNSSNDPIMRPDSVMGQYRRHSPSNRHRRSNRNFTTSPSPPPGFGQSGRQKYNPLRNTDSPFRFNGQANENDNRNGLMQRRSDGSFREGRPLSPVKVKNFTTASEFFLKKSDNYGESGQQNSNRNNDHSHNHFSSSVGGGDSHEHNHNGGENGGKPKCQCRHHQNNHNHEKKEPNPAFVQAKRVFKYGNDVVFFNFNFWCF